MRALWSPGTCRPFLPLFVILATMSCFLHCTDPAPVGKMYPRGNHWAVGHLMGKKSLPSVSSSQHPASDRRERLRKPRTEETARLQRNTARLERRSRTLTSDQTHNLALLHSRWRREDRYKYLRETVDLLLLALKLQENGPK